MKDKIEQFLYRKRNLTEDLQKYVNNQEIPLNDRWELFILSKLGEHDSYYHSPDGIDWTENTLYDDFYADRYATLTCDDMLETAIENEIIEEGSAEEKEFKEYFLSRFIYSFANNW